MSDKIELALQLNPDITIGEYSKLGLVEEIKFEIKAQKVKQNAQRINGFVEVKSKYDGRSYNGSEYLKNK